MGEAGNKLERWSWYGFSAKQSISITALLQNIGLTEKTYQVKPKLIYLKRKKEKKEKKVW